MSSLWSEALARKTKSAALDFPKVRTGKILHIYSQEHETLPGQISSFESSASQTRFLNVPGPWSTPGMLRAVLEGLYLHYSVTNRCSFTSIILCFFIFSHCRARMCSQSRYVLPTVFIFFFILFFFLFQTMKTDMLA